MNLQKKGPIFFGPYIFIISILIPLNHIQDR